MPYNFSHAHNVLNVLRGVNLTGIPSVYVMLFTVMPPARDQAGTELSVSGYTRQLVAFNAPSAGLMASSAKVTMSASTPVAWNNIVGFGLITAATGGTLLGYEAFPSIRSFPAGTEVSFAAGAIQVEN